MAAMEDLSCWTWEAMEAAASCLALERGKMAACIVDS